jgi:AcrR family transcriptional regulator
MPKTFSDAERAYIKNRLMEEAQACLAQFGIRKTTVDELVRRANIPKGTFYLFYPSKELLFFDVICALHDRLHDDMLRRIGELEGNITLDTVTDLLLSLYLQVDSMAIYSLTVSGDYDMLVRKLPPEMIRAHAKKDDFIARQLLSLLPGMHIKESDAKVLSGALRAIFCTMPHRCEIGEDVFEDAIRMMLRGVVAQLF